MAELSFGDSRGETRGTIRPMMEEEKHEWASREIVNCARNKWCAIVERLLEYTKDMLRASRDESLTSIARIALAIEFKRAMAMLEVSAGGISSTDEVSWNQHVLRIYRELNSDGAFYLHPAWPVQGFYLHDRAIPPLAGLEPDE